MFYFAWCNEGDVFDNNRHAREDEKVFHLRISQKEGEIAQAHLRVRRETLERGTQNNQWMWISFVHKSGNIFPLLKGRVSHVNQTSKGPLAEMTLVAVPLNWEKQLEALQERDKKHPHWDELFEKETDHGNVYAFQQGGLSYYHCDPVTHQVSEENLFSGPVIDLGHRFDGQSLKIEEKTPPLRAVRMRVHAQWVQKSSGIVNIARKIERAFKGGVINTYTGVNFVGRWPKRGRGIGQSGLQVVDSQLDELFPTHSHFRHTRRSVRTQIDGGQDELVIPRRWFRGKIHVGWKYRQKRHETLEFELPILRRPKEGIPGDIKTLDITLQNIFPPGEAMFWMPEHMYGRGWIVAFNNKLYRAKEAHTSKRVFEEELWDYVADCRVSLRGWNKGTFFLTPRGKRVAECAMLMARRELAKSVRSIRVTVKAALEDVSEISVKSCLRLLDARFPGGRLLGKVVDFTLVADGETGEKSVLITLACVPSMSSERAVGEDNDSTFEAGVVSEQEICQVEDLSYESYSSQCPTSGIVYPEYMYGHRWVRGVQVKHPPEEQQGALSRCRTYGEISRILTTCRTTLRVIFWDLRTKPCLRHTIRVKIKGGWSPPSALQWGGKSHDD